MSYDVNKLEGQQEDEEIPAYVRRNQALEQESAETLSELSPMDVFSKRIALEEFETDSEKARLERMTIKFKQVMEEVSYGADSQEEIEER